LRHRARDEAAGLIVIDEFPAHRIDMDVAVPCQGHEDLRP
jgi:hypothetical protein